MKHWAVLIGMAATALTAAAVEPVRAQPSKPGPVQAPFWGDALFHVYQGKTFSALTTLMASQRFGRVAPHADEAEATRGGLLLAYRALGALTNGLAALTGAAISWRQIAPLFAAPIPISAR